MQRRSGEGDVNSLLDKIVSPPTFDIGLNKGKIILWLLMNNFVVDRCRASRREA